MKALVLVTEAFGGRGGIAQYNRNLLAGLCSYPGFSEVVALPRVIRDDTGNLPDKLAYLEGGASGKPGYLLSLLKALMKGSDFSLVFSGHINLLPMAEAAAAVSGSPLLLQLHGIEAWSPTKSALVNGCARRAKDILSVSRYTLDRFRSWGGRNITSSCIVPNCVDLERFSPGPASRELTERYGIEGKKVILTIARLDERERYKGVDEVLDVLPMILKEVPDLVYLVCGEGGDNGRLERRAEALGIRGQVVFAGYIREDEKTAHYRLADVFVMPGRGEGFGIVYLEAMACGVPVIASKADGSREVLKNGKLGLLVDPDNALEIKEGILNILQSPQESFSPKIQEFSCEHFSEKIHDCMENILSRSQATGIAREAFHEEAQ